MRYYLDKHLGCETHRQALRGTIVQDEDTEDVGSSAQGVPCEAIKVGDPETGGRLVSCKREFALWASYTNLKVRVSETAVG